MFLPFSFFHLHPPAPRQSLVPLLSFKKVMKACLQNNIQSQALKGIKQFQLQY